MRVYGPIGLALFLGLVASLACVVRGSALAATTPEASAALALPDVVAVPGAYITVPVMLSLDQGMVYSVDLVIAYDPSVATAISVTQGIIASAFSLAGNLGQPGIIRVGLASATPATAGG